MLQKRCNSLIGNPQFSNSQLKACHVLEWVCASLGDNFMESGTICSPDQMEFVDQFNGRNQLWKPLLTERALGASTWGSWLRNGRQISKFSPKSSAKTLVSKGSFGPKNIARLVWSRTSIRVRGCSNTDKFPWFCIKNERAKGMDVELQQVS